MLKKIVLTCSAVSVLVLGIVNSQAAKGEVVLDGSGMKVVPLEGITGSLKAPTCALKSPQPDTIYYDNNHYAYIDTFSNAWTGVRFTPTKAIFELRSIYFAIYNPYSVAPGCSLYVVADDGEGKPDWPGGKLASLRVPPILWDRTWMQIDLATPIDFVAGEDFHIIYGPCPNGSSQPGWWSLFDDDGTTTYRSYISHDNRQSWLTVINCDAFIRAGGLYYIPEGVAIFGTQSLINEVLAHFMFNITHASHTTTSYEANGNGTTVIADHTFETYLYGDTLTEGKFPMVFEGQLTYNWDATGTVEAVQGELIFMDSVPDAEGGKFELEMWRLVVDFSADYDQISDDDCVTQSQGEAKLISFARDTTVLSHMAIDSFLVNWPGERPEVVEKHHATVAENGVVQQLDGQMYVLELSDSTAEFNSDMQVSWTDTNGTHLFSSITEGIWGIGDGENKVTFDALTMTAGTDEFTLAPGEEHFRKTVWTSDSTCLLQSRMRIGNPIQGYKLLERNGEITYTSASGEFIAYGSMVTTVDGQPSPTRQFYIDGPLNDVCVDTIQEDKLGYWDFVSVEEWFKFAVFDYGDLQGEAQDWVASTVIDYTKEKITGEFVSITKTVKNGFSLSGFLIGVGIKTLWYFPLAACNYELNSQDFRPPRVKYQIVTFGSTPEYGFTDFRYKAYDQSLPISGSYDTCFETRSDFEPVVDTRMVSYSFGDAEGNTINGYFDMSVPARTRTGGVKVEHDDVGGALAGFPGKKCDHLFKITNTGNVWNTFNLAVQSVPKGWTVKIYDHWDNTQEINKISIPGGGQRWIRVKHHVPPLGDPPDGCQLGDIEAVTLSATGTEQTASDSDHGFTEVKPIKVLPDPFPGTDPIPTPGGCYKWSADGDPLTWDISACDVYPEAVITLWTYDLPPNSEFPEVSGTDCVTSTFTFNPDSNQIGSTYPVTFMAQDDSGHADSVRIEITIEPSVGVFDELSVKRILVFALAQNYPNPFNPITQIKYALPRDCYVKLEIYNILGQKVVTLVDEHQTAGYKVVRWDGRNEKSLELPSGIYFYSLQAGGYREVKKMVLLK